MSSQKLRKCGIGSNTPPLRLRPALPWPRRNDRYDPSGSDWVTGRTALALLRQHSWAPVAAASCHRSSPSKPRSASRGMSSPSSGNSPRANEASPTVQAPIWAPMIAWVVHSARATTRAWGLAPAPSFRPLGGRPKRVWSTPCQAGRTPSRRSRRAASPPTTTPPWACPGNQRLSHPMHNSRRASLAARVGMLPSGSHGRRFWWENP
jgi:hypothetical protein